MIARQLEALTTDALGDSRRHPWAIVPLEQLIRNAKEIEGTPDLSPETEATSEGDVRWTRGIALPVVAASESTLTDTHLAHLRWTSDGRAVAVAKRDFVDSVGWFDPDRRLGGWGAIAAVIQGQIRGLWTARSLRTVRGLIARQETLPWEL